jgi:hypothetical protein
MFIRKMSTVTDTDTALMKCYAENYNEIDLNNMMTNIYDIERLRARPPKNTKTSHDESEDIKSSSSPSIPLNIAPQTS